MKKNLLIILLTWPLFWISGNVNDYLESSGSVNHSIRYSLDALLFFGVLSSTLFLFQELMKAVKASSALNQSVMIFGVIMVPYSVILFFVGWQFGGNNLRLWKPFLPW